MPYQIKKSGAGFKVTSPNHPHGFSEHPQSAARARKQELAIMVNSHEDIHGNKAGKKIGVRRAKS